MPFENEQKELERKFASLMKKYEELKKMYEKERGKINVIIFKKNHEKRMLGFTFAIIGIAGIIKYQSLAIPIVGFFVMACDLLIELYATKKGFWAYKDYTYKIAGRVPIEIPFIYFFLGAFIVIYILFRTVGL